MSTWDVLGCLGDERENAGHEGHGLLGLLDHLTHVVDDGARLAADDGIGLLSVFTCVCVFLLLIYCIVFVQASDQKDAICGRS